jgi:hypothetical protein
VSKRSGLRLILQWKEGDRIVAITPEIAHGPAWGNAVTWVYIQDREGKIRRESIQPTERPVKLDTLFDAAEVIYNGMLSAIMNDLLHRRRKDPIE